MRFLCFLLFFFSMTSFMLFLKVFFGDSALDQKQHIELFLLFLMFIIAIV